MIKRILLRKDCTNILNTIDSATQKRESSIVLASKDATVFDNAFVFIELPFTTDTALRWAPLCVSFLHPSIIFLLSKDEHFIASVDLKKKRNNKNYIFMHKQNIGKVPVNNTSLILQFNRRVVDIDLGCTRAILKSTVELFSCLQLCELIDYVSSPSPQSPSLRSIEN